MIFSGKIRSVVEDGGSPEKDLPSRWQSCLLPFLLFTGLQVFPWLWTGLKKDIFCLPASVVSAVLLGVERVRDADGYPILVLSGQGLRVGESCSGYDFFCLGAAILLWLILRGRDRIRSEALLSAGLICLPLALLATFLANISRLCCVAVLSSPAEVLVPFHWQGLFHYTLGVLVFLPYLLGLTLFFERISNGFRHRSL